MNNGNLSPRGRAIRRLYDAIDLIGQAERQLTDAIDCQWQATQLRVLRGFVTIIALGLQTINRNAED